MNCQDGIGIIFCVNMIGHIIGENSKMMCPNFIAFYRATFLIFKGDFLIFKGDFEEHRDEICQ